MASTSVVKSELKTERRVFDLRVRKFRRRQNLTIESWQGGREDVWRFFVVCVFVCEEERERRKISILMDSGLKCHEWRFFNFLSSSLNHIHTFLFSLTDNRRRTFSEDSKLQSNFDDGNLKKSCKLMQIWTVDFYSHLCKLFSSVIDS